MNSGVNIISSTEAANGSFGGPAFYFPYTAGQSCEGVPSVPSLDLCGGHGRYEPSDSISDANLD